MGGRSMDPAMGPRLQAAWRVAVRETKVMLCLTDARSRRRASLIIESQSYPLYSGASAVLA